MHIYREENKKLASITLKTRNEVDNCIFPQKIKRHKHTSYQMIISFKQRVVSTQCFFLWVIHKIRHVKFDNFDPLPPPRHAFEKFTQLWATFNNN